MQGLAWWRCEGALQRFVADLLSAEARALGINLPAPAWHPSAQLDEAGLGVDSLDRVALAAALSEAAHLHRGGSDNLLTHDQVGAWCRVTSGALDNFSDALTFRTSGSSGRPRAYTHALDCLLEEVDALVALIPGRKRVLTFVPSHHIYGFLFTQLLPARLGVPVLDLRDHSPGALATLAQEGDLVVGHPFSWAAALRAAPSRWSKGVVGVTSGACCPMETAEAALATGLDRLVDMYGATETAGIGWRDDPHGTYRLLPHWRREADGLVRGLAPVVEIPDLLRWVGDRRFEVVGRRDCMVQVGGHNVSLARVQAILLGHPGVSGAAVRPMRADEGSRLKAFVVPVNPEEQEDVLRQELTAFVTAKLQPAERPRSFNFGDTLPLGSAGKPVDWPVAAAEQGLTLDGKGAGIRPRG